MSLVLEIKKLENNQRLCCSGRIIDVDVKKFSAKMEFMYKKKEPRFILDISEVNFIDSHGLGIIVYYNSMMAKENRQLVILNSGADPGSYVTRLFEITNLHKVLNIISDIESLQ